MGWSRVFGLPSRIAAIAAALLEIKDFDTILGKFSFDPNGEPVYDPVVLIVKDGKLEVLSKARRDS